VDVIELDDLCPNCGSQSLDVNRVCGRCGVFSPETPDGVWGDGTILVARKSATFPYRCLKTNEPAESLLRKKLSWHPQWVYVLVVISPIICLIAALIVLKRATFDLPYCLPVRKRIRNARIGMWISIPLALALVFLCFALTDWIPLEVMMTVLSIGLLVIIVAVVFCLNFLNPIVPTRITDTHVWLKRVHADYLALLPEWDGDDD